MIIRKRIILKSAIFLSILFELILIVLVYNKIGGERISGQIIRLLFQLILILFVLTKKSNISLFLLMSYHILNGLYGFSFLNLENTFELFTCIFHLIIGICIYFHDWIEDKLNL